MLHLLDLIGVFTFAFYGALKGAQHEFNFFGVVACGFIVAFAGGTLRELMLNSQPLYFQDYTYLYVAFAGIMLGWLGNATHRHLQHPLVIADAVGMATFAYIGVSRADHAGLGFAAMALFAVLTAAGGGIICDVITGTKPSFFSNEYYIAPILLFALTYALFHHHLTPAIILVLIVGTATMRLFAVYRKQIEAYAVSGH